MNSPAGRRRFHDYQDLMRHRVMDILLASTPYDTFILEEAGELSERLLGEFRNLDLHYAPALTGVSSGEAALRLARERSHVNLIITTPHLADMDAAELARRARREGLDAPVVLLAWDTRELAEFQARHDTSDIERTFLWQGDARILVGIVKSVEDRRNAPHDTREVGVQVILLVEDNVRYYSSFLPVMYTELLHHSQRVIKEGLNISQQILRMRARPKILLCTTWEEAEAAFAAYGEDVLGIISDVEFPRRGQKYAQAGADFARHVRGAYPDVPIVLHSSRPENEALARSLGADFLLKGSPLLLQELREVMLEHFGFGDFVFRTPEGTEVGRAADLRGLEARLAEAPEPSLLYHAARNHFSRWLKARTEFALAHELRPRRLSDYPTGGELRRSLIGTIAGYRREQARALVTDFDRADFDLSGDFYRMGGGSLGGKARGLAFVRRTLAEQGLRERFPGVEIAVPVSAVLGTDVFDRFLDDNDLRWFAIECENEAEIRARFETAPFPEEAARDVAAFLERATWPLAVRSSSLLEDSQHQPFTGVYDTLMLANDAASHAERVRLAISAVKRVYASTFSAHAKAYLRATPYRLEEEKMAVILQRIVGAARGSRFYPDFSGVARSHNFYPSPPMSARDGIAAVALGMGRAIVEGGVCLRFCPRYPTNVMQFSSVADMLESTQRDFWALPLDALATDGRMREESYPLAAAESDGTLARLASTWSPENDAVYDGLSRPGPRLVTFAPILKHDLFPLAPILETLMKAGEDGMGTPVEIEFAVNLAPPPGRPCEFGFVQLRPLSVMRETEALELGDVEEARVLCRSARVLGNGRVEGLRDLVVVDFQRFERARSREAAAEVGRLNGLLQAGGTPYLLVGVGRWGSRDPWLGIPVTWDQVSGAAVIVEAGLRDLKVTPSQGTHFFQNLTSFNVGYFTVNPETGDGTIDWDWLYGQPARSAAEHVRHVRLAEPVLVLMNGKKNEGLILKP
ncbi:MAG: PEP/pyruvate-binding domain-containing protein [Vicinamibacteria bacterium]